MVYTRYMNVQIESLTEKTKYEARDLVVKADIGPSLRVIKFFNKSLRQQHNNIFLAMVDDHIVGIIGWYIDDGHWAGKSLGKLFPYGNDIYWVSYFAVIEEYRGKGIGKILMEKLFGEMKKKHAKVLWVYTRKARGFYEKMGFQFVTRTHIESCDHDFLKYEIGG